MDKLTDLPPTQSPSTPAEEAVMNQFFGPPGEPAKTTSRFGRIEWKLLGATALLFVLLANPWSDLLLCKVPYCGGSMMTSLITKTVLFVIILAILYMFL